MDNQCVQMEEKSRKLSNTTFGDFGTRRRRNYTTQDSVVACFRHNQSFVGTSNVHLAHKHNVRPLGTQAHEWYMGVSALEGLRRANYYGMKIWSDIFRGRLGTALPDTFGTDAFFEDFDHYFARLFDGVRHDSGNPFVFAGKTIDAYQKLKINPKTRTILFSDNLNCDLAVEIQKELASEIGISFGIGTHFTNDFPGSKPLNMVIKMASCNGVKVVKISDEPSKQIGDRDALRVANWTFNNTPLDQTNG
jgi:nicotinate phosphoribosyltransferase